MRHNFRVESAHRQGHLKLLAGVTSSLHCRLVAKTEGNVGSCSRLPQLSQIAFSHFSFVQILLLARVSLAIYILGRLSHASEQNETLNPEPHKCRFGKDLGAAVPPTSVCCLFLNPFFSTRHPTNLSLDAIRPLRAASGSQHGLWRRLRQRSGFVRRPIWTWQRPNIRPE